MEIAPVVCYVAGPYRDSRGPYYIEQNIRRAEAVALELWRLGIPTLCPHANTRLFDGAAPDQVWLAGDLELLRRCDCVVVVPDTPGLTRWIESRGTMGELEQADRAGLPVFYWPQSREALLEWVRGRASR